MVGTLSYSCVKLTASKFNDRVISPRIIRRGNLRFEGRRGKVPAVTVICKTGVVVYVSNRISNTPTLNESQFNYEGETSFTEA